MDKERLDLYKALAKTRVYKERFGDLCKGDPYWDSVDHKIDYFDAYFDLNEDGIPYYDRCSLWLPPVYDPERPERSLWGMVNKQLFVIEGMFTNGEITVRRRYGEAVLCIAPLDLALIKAILAQEVKP